MFDKKTRSCCFTGHRNIPYGCTKKIKERLEAQIELLIGQEYTYFLAGGALGFDTAAAQAVLKLREKYPHIRLILILPHLSQSAAWSEKDRRIYDDIKERADRVFYTSESCMHKRNRCLVDNSSACICYLTSGRGGTAYTVNYAVKQGLYVVNIAKEI